MSGKADISAKVGVEGEQALSKALKEANAGLKTLAAEAKMVASSLDAETSAEQKAARQKEVLTKQIQAQKDKLKLLEEGLQKSTDKYGENDAKTQKWQASVYNAQTELNKLEAELKKTTTATDQMGNEVKDTDKQVDELGASMKDAGKESKNWADVMKGSLAAEAIKSGFTKLVDLAKQLAASLKEVAIGGAKVGDELVTQSQITGLSTDTLQEYNYMVGLVDVSVETITGSMTKMQKSMKAASKGSGEAYEAYKRLGVSVQNADGSFRDVEDVFNDVIAAMGHMEDETDRDTTAMTLMGKSAKELNPLIAAGTDKIEALRKEAHDTGYVMDTQTVKSLQKTRDAMDRLNKRTENLKNQFSAGMTAGVERFTAAMDKTLANPRVAESIDIISAGLGDLIGSFAELTAKVLPEFIKFFSNANTELALFSDEQLERSRRIKTDAKNWDILTQSYTDNAMAVIDSKKKNEELFQALKDVVDENGLVKKGNEEIAQQIVNELNEKLGLNIEVIDGVVQKWQEVQEEAQNAINAQTAAALISAGEEQYTEALKNKGQTTSDIIDITKDIREQEKAVAELNAKLAEEEEIARNLPGYYNKGEEFVGSYTATTRGELIDAQNTLNLLQGNLTDAQTQLNGYLVETGRYEAAQTALMEKNAEQAIDIMTRENGVAVLYNAERRKLSEQEFQELQDAYKHQLDVVQYYHDQRKAGNAAFRDEDVAAEEAYLLELQNAILKQGEDERNAKAATASWERATEVETTGALKTELEARKGYTLENYDWIKTQAEKTGEDSVTGMAQKMDENSDKMTTAGQTAGKKFTSGVTGEVGSEASKINAGSAAEPLGTALSDGLARGINIKTVTEKMRSTIEAAIQAGRLQAQVNSPSKRTKKIGKGLADGLVVGMDDETEEVKAAAQRMADAAVGNYENAGWTASGAPWTAPGASQYTTSIGGITLYVSGAGVQNVDQLADRVASKLTQQVRRAQRAR